MKISYNWLKDFINIDQSPEELGKVLTNLGLEVEGMVEYGNTMDGLVVGKVITCGKHPDADRLSVTTVDIGNGVILNVVCGAPNVKAGQKVIIATEGTELMLGDKKIKIKKSKLRGVDSEGMICAEDEIGLGTSHEGIMVLDENATVGMPASEYFNMTRDTIFEIGLTPNRIDAASHFGTARDLAAFFNLSGKGELKRPFVADLKPDDHNMPVPIEIQDPAGCPRFTGVVITGIHIAPSPAWMQNRLRSIGLSPINNVVDITNYVLHELGQPLHAYDADKLHDRKIIVRRPPEGTKFTTLDGIERVLSGEDVMVCDGRDPVCIAGVFGGLTSGITESTKNVFLESACFDPVSVRKTSRRHGLNTDASFRFERGVDPENTLVALKRAASMIKEMAGGIISSDIMDVYPRVVKPVQINVLYSHIDRLIGKSIDRKLIHSILKSLDIIIIKKTDEGITVQVAPYRVDVTREADVIEELLRIYGYNNVEFPDKIHMSVSPSAKPDNEKLVNEVSSYLTHSGFTEIMSNSLTKKDYYKNIRQYPEKRLVPLLNPLSADLGVMRQTLLFGGLEAIARNINHKNENLRFYEFGRIYSLLNQDVTKFENFVEEPVFGLFLTGNFERQTWTTNERPADFFQLKAFYLNILKILGIGPGKLGTFDIPSGNSIFKGGLEYRWNDKRVLCAGPVSKDILDTFKIEQEVFFAELWWEELLAMYSGSRSFKELPKYPEVRRDLALLLDSNVSYSQIEKLASQAGGKLLKGMEIFDFFKGKNIPENKKSYAVSFFLQDLEKTLTDSEIDQIMNNILKVLKDKLGAEIR